MTKQEFLETHCKNCKVGKNGIPCAFSYSCHQIEIASAAWDAAIEEASKWLYKDASDKEASEVQMIRFKREMKGGQQ